MNSPKTTWCGAVAAAAAALATAGLDPTTSKVAGIVAAIATALMGYFAKDHDSPSLEQSRGRVLEGRVPLLLLLAGVLTLGSGCALYGKRTPGETVSFTQSFVGIDVSQDPTSQVPHFRIGFGRNQGHIIPTSTNVLYSPSLDSSISLDTRVGSHAIAEDFRMGTATTNAAPEARATSSPNAPAARPR